MKRNEIILNTDFERYNKKNTYMPEKIHSNLSARVFREIENVFEADIWVSSRGELWISTRSLHSLLRTSPSNARYIVQGLRDSDKLEIEDVIFVRIAELASIIYKFIEEESSFKRRAYLKFTEDCLQNIRDESDVVLKRLEQLEYTNSVIKDLKKRRIKDHKITRDELTKEKLQVKESEFSHIRSKSLFPQFAADLENGLIVNYETHRLITSRSINDEEELLQLCFELGWETDWYRRYKGYYN